MLMKKELVLQLVISLICISKSDHVFIYLFIINLFSFTEVAML